MSTQSVDDQCNMMLGMISRMNPTDRDGVYACLNELRSVAAKYSPLAVVAFSVMTVEFLIEKEQHGKD